MEYEINIVAILISCLLLVSCSSSTSNDTIKTVSNEKYYSEYIEQSMCLEDNEEGGNSLVLNDKQIDFIKNNYDESYYKWQSLDATAEEEVIRQGMLTAYIESTAMHDIEEATLESEYAVIKASQIKENKGYFYRYFICRSSYYGDVVLYAFYDKATEELDAIWGRSSKVENLSKDKFDNVKLIEHPFAIDFDAFSSIMFFGNYYNKNMLFLSNGQTGELGYFDSAVSKIDETQSYNLCWCKTLFSLNALQIIKTEDMPDNLLE